MVDATVLARINAGARQPVGGRHAGLMVMRDGDGQDRQEPDWAALAGEFGLVSVPVDFGRFNDFQDLDALVETVETHEDLTGFVFALEANLHHDPEAWENRTLESYLDALQRFTTSLDSWARNNAQALPVQPTWHLIARLLLIARTYE
ncbi:hypothetical protein ABZV78_06395 [Micromonospora sp. NPDC004540]|uniref:DUF7660 family protein n=1 Tax=Micromonospora sp. NPDC004540 TaxID=3154457 RepID=UPI0033B2F658